VIVPSLAPSRAASASNAELRIDNVPTYDRRDTSNARVGGSIVAPAFMIRAFEAAFVFAVGMTCDSVES